MSSLIIILLLAYNIWILSVLMRPPKGTSPQEPLPEVSDKPIYEVVGASKFSMADQEASKVNTEIQFQQAAEEESAEEEVSETDVAFEETKEDLDEVFTDHRIEDVADDEWDEEHRTAETATGHSFNDLGKAVDTARKVRATRKEKLAAGEVLSDIRGTETGRTDERERPLPVGKGRQAHRPLHRAPARCETEAHHPRTQGDSHPGKR